MKSDPPDSCTAPGHGHAPRRQISFVPVVCLIRHLQLETSVGRSSPGFLLLCAIVLLVPAA